MSPVYSLVGATPRVVGHYVIIYRTGDNEGALWRYVDKKMIEAVYMDLVRGGHKIECVARVQDASLVMTDAQLEDAGVYLVAVSKDGEQRAAILRDHPDRERRNRVVGGWMDQGYSVKSVHGEPKGVTIHG